MATQDNGRTQGHCGNIIDVAGLELQYKKDKSRTKANFTRTRNSLLILLEEQDLPSRREVKGACDKMDGCMDLVMKVLENFSEYYIQNGNLQKGQKIVNEMEKIEEEFYTAYEAAREYLDSRRDDASSVASDILSIDLLQRMNITDGDSETSRKETMPTMLRKPAPKVTSSRLCKSNIDSMLATMNNVPLRQSSPVYTPPISDNRYNLESNKVPKIQNRTEPLVTQFTNDHNPLYETSVNVHTAPNTTFNDAVSTTPVTVSNEAQSLGQDLWRQLKRVEIPVFAGDKRTYQGWKSAFAACIDSAPVTGEYKLLQLRQYLTGEALRCIENLGHSAASYEAAKERLERKYGGKRRQIALYLEELDQFRHIRSGNAKDLESFADLLDIAILNLQEAGQHHELGDGSLYTKLQRKLPESLLARYHRWVYENDVSESVLTLKSWVLKESEFQTVAAETVHGVNGSITDASSTQVSRYRNPLTLFGDQAESKAILTSQCRLCGERHGIWICNDFLQKSVPERWNIAKRLQLCYRCLAEGHTGKSCTRTRVCGENGCLEVHHKLLHRRENIPYHQRNTAYSTNRNHNGNNESHVTTSSSTEHVSGTEGKEPAHETTMTSRDNVATDFIALRTVPVVLKNGSRSLHVNALLDDASTKTYINADVAAELGIQGTTDTVTVNVLNGQVETFETSPIDVELKSVNGNLSRKITAFTANRVTGNMTAFDWNQCIQQWPHLNHIQFPVVAERPIVDVLIGADCADLHCAIKKVQGRSGEPIARLTPLGWTCVGCPGSHRKELLQTNFANTYFAKDQSGIEELNANIKRFWEIDDSMVVKAGKDSPNVRYEDKSAMRTVQNSLSFENWMYRVGVPWKGEKQMLPDNYSMAMRRLTNTEKRLERSPRVATAYNETICQYIEKGYIRRIPKSEHSSTRWYLPHFPVVRPDKETTKTRIVFDASATCEGVSLNDVIYQGPKLQRDLFDILLRFRRFPIAMVCDIAEMYLRIGLPEDDKPYHRFLWRGTDKSKPPDVYEFDRVVFGVNSSPFQAQFVLQHHAQKHKIDLPLAAETIQKSTYMDDSMDSVFDEDQGIQLYKELSNLLTKAGMHARKWLSNSQKVLSEIPIHDRKSEVDLDCDQLPCAKTLGVWWLADKDIFTFRECTPDNSMLFTKRTFLKKIATLFDPIGFLAPFTIRAKILMQEMWTSGLDWDENLTEPLTKSARAWFEELENLRLVQVPRCFLKNGMLACATSLHTFVDASEDAYGAVVYARCIYGDESVSSTIIAAKTRVAPTMATSIPRLELMAAVVGLRLTTRINEVLELPMSSCCFWSDSLNVLWWIRGCSREFKPFVANRVGEIQTSTSPDQWRYVPTDLNPADILSRGMSAADLVDCQMWWRGPEFLLQKEDLWPVCKVPPSQKPPGDDEMKSSSRSKQQQSTSERSEADAESNYAFVTLGEGVSFPVDPTRHSSWLKIKRILAWVNRFADNCRRIASDRTFGELQSSELKRAETQLIRYAQSTEFSEDWNALSHGRSIPSGSKLIALQPKLDDDGLMRSDGRLKHAKFLSFDVRYPVILPRQSWITKLIVKDYHEKGNHASGTNQTLAAISARYWVMSGREAIRSGRRGVPNVDEEKRKRVSKSWLHCLFLD